MTTISITHDHADGTVLTGDPRPHHQLCKDAGLRYSRRIPGWYLPNSRDRAPQTARIERLAEGLRGVGFDVDVELDDDRRPPAEREAARVERLADRQAGLERKAERLGSVADARFAKARETMDMIPLGQPILVGHHSERRHRKDLASIDTNIGKGVEAHREAQEAQRRAEASRATQAHRESGPATERRIARIETDLRDLARKIEGKPCALSGRKMKPEAVGRELRCPECYGTVTIGEDLLSPEHFHTGKTPASGAWLESLVGRQAALTEDLAFWREHLASLAADGEHRAWGPDDFAPGDRVNDSATVVRVNKKSLTVTFDAFAYCSFTNALPYNKVRSHQPAQEASA